MGEEELINALTLTKNEKTAKNVILFVGDGMGPNTIAASRIYLGGESSRLKFETFPNVGLLKVREQRSNKLSRRVEVLRKGEQEEGEALLRTDRSKGGGVARK